MARGEIIVCVTYVVGKAYSYMLATLTWAGMDMVNKSKARTVRKKERERARKEDRKKEREGGRERKGEKSQQPANS